MSRTILPLAALALFAATAATSDAQAEEWRFAIEEIPGSIMDTYAQEFKARIEEETGGDVTLTIYHHGSLGTPTQTVEQTADGVIQLTHVSIGNLGTIVPESQFFLLNYVLPDDSEAVQRLLSESRVVHEELARDFEKKGLKLGSLYSHGPQVWTTNRPIRTPEDFEGFKMRVMVSPLLLEAYTDLGANPTPIPFGEVYGALQLRQVDGQVNPVSAIEEMKFYEVTNYMIWAGEQELITAVLAGLDWYEGLSSERQELLDRTLVEMNEFIAPEVERFNREKLEVIQEAKPEMELIELTQEEREAFSERAQATHSAVARLIGPRGEELLSQWLAEIEAVQ
jgi:TRAP-type transport system periplasmic protein